MIIRSFALGFGILSVVAICPRVVFGEPATPATDLGRHGRAAVAREVILNDYNNDSQVGATTDTAENTSEKRAQQKPARAQLGVTSSESTPSDKGRHGRSSMAREKILTDN